MTTTTSFTYRAAAGAMAACVGLALSAPVYAQGGGGAMRDMQLQEDTNTLFGDALDFIKNNSYIRLGVGHLAYKGDSSNLKVEDAQGLAAQAFGPGTSTLENTGSSLGDKTFPAGTIGLYMPWTGRHLAAEVTISAPIKLDFQVTGRAASESLVPTVLDDGTGNAIATGVPPLGENIGTLKTFPPNISFVYRPWVDTAVRPFVGVGAMYLYTFDTDISNQFLNSQNEPQLYLSKPLACTAKAGVDVDITDQLFFSLSAEYIGCAEVKAELNNINVRAPNLSNQFGPIDIGTISSTNDFEAILYQASFGIQF
ncbi:OmpW family outer membrane protein [uncultured Salinisphaera sp.]|uniref:OmpW/AlkL family protein n=1 Tax=Salinisphaera sp. C84B14 TaxID=1304155 RepID=UPI0032B136A8|tara:strand:+ start:769 stop:1701 length:933 start_codon:yes stop_codon:yes gene_type:complete